MRKQIFAGLWPPPAPGTRLWLTLAGLIVGGLHLVFLAEVWPGTPAAKVMLLVLEWLLVLALLPQGLWWAWRWLRAYTGPGWLRVLVTAVFLSGVCGAVALWLAVLVGGSLLWLDNQPMLLLLKALQDKHIVRLLPALGWLLVLVVLLRLAYWGWRAVRIGTKPAWQLGIMAVLAGGIASLILFVGIPFLLILLLMAGWD